MVRFGAGVGARGSRRRRPSGRSGPRAALIPDAPRRAASRSPCPASSNYAPGMADMSSRRAASAVQIAAGGEPVYVVRSGRSYRGVRARDVGNGLFVINEPVRNVRISEVRVAGGYRVIENTAAPDMVTAGTADRQSTRLNSSH